MVNIQKAAIIGCGFVGASSAFSLLQKGIFSELVLIDANKEKAEGEAMDISHGRPYAHPMKIYAGSYDDISDCSLIIITAGANQKPGETRLDLVHKNVAIFKSIIPEITKRGFEGILLIVANPVDILTYAALKISGYPKERVFGSGTVLDTARFRYLLSEHLQVASRSVHANIIGEHGDSELAVWSGANVAGIPINDFCELRGHYQHQESMERIYKTVRDSAYDIIQKKGATYYGVAMAVARIAESIVMNENAVLPVTSLMEGEYGLEGLCISVPTIVSQKGAEKVLEIPLSDEEKENQKKITFKDYVSAFKIPGVWIMAILVWCYVTISAVASYLTPYSTGVLGMSATLAATIGTFRTYGCRLIGRQDVQVRLQGAAARAGCLPCDGRHFPGPARRHERRPAGGAAASGRHRDVPVQGHILLHPARDGHPDDGLRDGGRHRDVCRLHPGYVRAHDVRQLDRRLRRVGHPGSKRPQRADRRLVRSLRGDDELNEQSRTHFCVLLFAGLFILNFN